jgi:hypothetical protein
MRRLSASWFQKSEEARHRWARRRKDDRIKLDVQTSDAKALGLTIPPDVFSIADEVIE